MGEIKTFTKAKLVTAILISDIEKKAGLINNLVSSFGQVDYESPLIPFTFTTYYDKEMGTPITRFFLAFKNLVSPDLLPEIKIKTNEIEGLYDDAGRRKANIDPGLLFLSRLILASTKDGSYRIPLRSGVYGEITLVYANGFKNAELTYPDFQSETYKSILNDIRNLYKSQL